MTVWLRILRLACRVYRSVVYGGLCRLLEESFSNIGLSHAYVCMGKASPSARSTRLSKALARAFMGGDEARARFAIMMPTCCSNRSQFRGGAARRASSRQRQSALHRRASIEHQLT